MTTPFIVLVVSTVVWLVWTVGSAARRKAGRNR